MLGCIGIASCFLGNQSPLDGAGNYGATIPLQLHAIEGKMGRINKNQLTRLTFWKKLGRLRRPIYWDEGSTLEKPQARKEHSS
jgi:hypothetical protein